MEKKQIYPDSGLKCRMDSIYQISNFLSWFVSFDYCYYRWYHVFHMILKPCLWHANWLSSTPSLCCSICYHNWVWLWYVSSTLHVPRSSWAAVCSRNNWALGSKDLAVVRGPDADATDSGLGIASSEKDPAAIKVSRWIVRSDKTLQGESENKLIAWIIPPDIWKVVFETFEQRTFFLERTGKRMCVIDYDFYQFQASNIWSSFWKYQHIQLNWWFKQQENKKKIWTWLIITTPFNVPSSFFSLVSTSCSFLNWWKFSEIFRITIGEPYSPCATKGACTLGSGAAKGCHKIFSIQYTLLHDTACSNQYVRWNIYRT